MKYAQPPIIFLVALILFSIFSSFGDPSLEGPRTVWREKAALLESDQDYFSRQNLKTLDLPLLSSNFSNGLRWASFDASTNKLNFKVVIDDIVPGVLGQSNPTMAMGSENIFPYVSGSRNDYFLMISNVLKTQADWSGSLAVLNPDGKKWIEGLIWRLSYLPASTGQGAFEKTFHSLDYYVNYRVVSVFLERIELVDASGRVQWAQDITAAATNPESEQGRRTRRLVGGL